jgi:hypothetical protein
MCMVKSPLTARVVTVADVGYKEYTLKLDIRFMSLRMGKATDHTNIDIAEGISPDATNGCTPAQSQEDIHPCIQFLEPTKCVLLQLDEEGVIVYSTDSFLHL